jgi:RNA polymerase sigma factor (sigma-70 family)
MKPTRLLTKLVYVRSISNQNHSQRQAVMFETSFNQNCYGSIPVNSFFPTNRTSERAGENEKSAEASLVNQAQHGDLTAFNELVLLYQEAVYRQAFWILGEVEAAEEAAQEAFLRVYRSIHTFHGGPFKPWILRITTNYCLDQLRRLKVRPTTPIEVFNEYDEEMEPPAWLADPCDSPEKMVEHAESETSIMQCIQRLSPDYQMVIVMVDLQEMDYQEAAAALGISLGTMKSRLFRARVQLRGIFQACGIKPRS